MQPVRKFVEVFLMLIEVMLHALGAMARDLVKIEPA